MFPHTVTVFNVIEDIDKTTYHSCVVSDVYCYNDLAISQEGHGEKVSSVYNVCFSENALKKYVDKITKDAPKDVFSLKNNDIVVYGEFDEIKDLKDIQKADVEYFLIKSISDNRVGSDDLQNILVSG